MTDNSEEAFLKELRATFAVEAQEHLQTLAAGLIDLEAAPSPERQQALIETVFRGVHSLKGAARAVENRAVEALCQSMESVLSALKHRRLEFALALADLLHTAMDALAQLLTDVSSDTPSKNLMLLCSRLDSAALGEPLQPTDEPVEKAALATTVAAPIDSVASEQLSAGDKVLSNDAAAKIDRLGIDEGPVSAPPDTTAIDAAADLPSTAFFSAKGEGADPARVHPAAAADEHVAAADTVRIASAKLDSLLRQAEGLLSAKLSAEQRVLDIEAIVVSVAALQKQQGSIATVPLRSATGQVATAAPDFSIGTGSERRAGPEFDMRLLAGQIDALRRSVYGDWQALAGRVDQLLEEMKKISMLPAASALKLFPKLVRDLARTSEKEVALHFSGGEIEVDRRILEEIRDPLIHLVRNCIDHGIEKPAERIRRGKPTQGSIELAVVQRDGGRVEILIGDDGAGIDVDRVRSAAVQLQPQAARELAGADADALLDLVFQSGVSTSPLITDISGRGLGLAIVREKVERLGGSIELQSQPGFGTQFRIVLPVTLATYRGVQVRCGSRYFVFPTTQVEVVTTVRRDAIKSVENRASVTVQGRVVAVVQLAELLGLPARVDSGATVALVVGVVGAGSAGEKRIAFMVDEVVDEQEVLVKSLGEQLERVRNIAGVTRLRSGAVALILNIADLMKSATQSGGRTSDVGAALAPSARKSILVAEDSITSRMLLKGMLESVGYKVTVAMDGEDALGRLRAELFDLVVSDVDMPRMNGLQLTAKIRADSSLAELPVVLVTTLASVADRERGAEVGASAYLVKSSFEQSNLLEVVRRLL